MRFESIRDFGLIKSKRIYEKVKVGNFFFSIQCGKGFYSTPMEDLELEQYEAFEFALYDNNQNWVNPHNYSFMKDCSILEYFEEGIINPIASYVPVGEIIGFANFINSIN